MKKKIDSFYVIICSVGLQGKMKKKKKTPGFWGVTRKLSLLGISHPVEGSLFQVQGVYRRTTLTRGCVLEESRIVALMFLYNMY